MAGTDEPLRRRLPAPVRRVGRAALVRAERARVASRRRLAAHEPTLSFEHLPVRQAIRSAYNVLLRRDPDPEGEAHFIERLTVERLPRAAFLDVLRGSEEFRFGVPIADLLTSLHLSRCDFVQGLPRARRILDLGGTHQQSREGAFVHLGYPYPFERLVLVDLPIEDRHELYRHSEHADVVASRLGPVEYAYHSMADLSRYADGSFDLVYAGQTIEHVSEADCRTVLAEVHRVLRAGGWFALDTPNGPACRLQQASFINDDHVVEYSHEEMTALLEGAGFRIAEAKGLNYLGAPLDEAVFDLATVAGNTGVYGEPRDCYLLAYVAQRP